MKTITALQDNLSIYLQGERMFENKESQFRPVRFWIRIPAFTFTLQGSQFYSVRIGDFPNQHLK